MNWIISFSCGCTSEEKNCCISSVRTILLQAARHLSEQCKTRCFAAISRV